MSNAKRLLPHTNATNKAVIRSIFRSYHHIDDTVDKNGFKNVLGDIGIDSAILEDDDVIKGLMEIMDTDNNGLVDFEEFFRWWSRIVGSNVEQVGDVMKGIGNLFKCYISYDTNGKGALTRDQFKKLWVEMENDPNLAEEAVNFVDQNHDNEISFQELCIAFGLL